MQYAIDGMDFTKTDDRKVILKCYKYRHKLRIYVSGFLHPVILLGPFLVSPALQAESPDGIPDKIAVYTSEQAPPAQQERKSPEIEIMEQSGAYQIKVVAVIDAPASHVLYVLTDYQHIYRLNPSIIENEVVQRHDDGSVNVRTRVVGCAAYFCDELDRVERVRILPSGDLYAEIIPELSEFKSGKTLWQIKSLGEHSEITYNSDLEPDVFIPPLLGKFLVKKSIREEMLVSFANLEKIASIMAEAEWREDYQPVQAGSGSYGPCSYTANNLYDSGY